MITVKELLKKKTFYYFKQRTGTADSTQQIIGINRVESMDLKHLIQRNELVITTGEAMSDISADCFELLVHIQKVGAAALIINIGPYIKTIPAEVIAYANELQLIIIEMPWRIRIADMTKTIFEELVLRTKQRNEELLFIDRLISGQVAKDEISPTLINALGANVLFEGIVVIVKQTNKTEMEMQAFHGRVREFFQKKYDKFISGNVGKMVIFIINRSSQMNELLSFSDFAKELYRYFEKKQTAIAIGKGDMYTHMLEMTKSYQEALQVITVVQNQDKKCLFKYKDLGVYQFLFTLKDSNVLTHFCKETLSSLWEYDRYNNQKYYCFLKVYLEENGQTTAIANRLFIHRNTVSYRIQRIEKILDRSLTNNLDRTSLSLAILIDDIFVRNCAYD